ncbi:MAG: hypothetical protein AB1679_35835 [Actinomycetota bacterium]
MVRRLFVPVLLAALTLGVAPAPAFGFHGRDGRAWSGDHFRCMYRCDDRGDSFRPPPRRPPWESWTRPRHRPPARPSRHRQDCWLFCGPGGRDQRGSDHGGWNDGGWGQRGWDRGWDHGGWNDGGWGHSRWSGRHRWCGPGSWHRPGRSCWHGGHRWHDHDRYDRPHRDRGRDHSGGYNAHRRHPRGRDF